VQEIAIRVQLREREHLGIADYERVVGSVATAAALIAWLPTPDARLVLRGRGAEPVRLETVSYGDVFEMLVVLDQRSAAVERAATAVSTAIAGAASGALEDDAAGVAGEIDRLDRAAPRGRSIAERSLRGFLEGARADVVARRTTARVRAASALVRLAEEGATLVVERVVDALDPIVEETAVEAAPAVGDEVTTTAPAPDPAATSTPTQKKPGKKDAKSSKKDAKKSAKKSKDSDKKAKSADRPADTTPVLPAKTQQKNATKKSEKKSDKPAKKAESTPKAKKGKRNSKKK
jgi:hypothetical protein